MTAYSKSRGNLIYCENGKDWKLVDEGCNESKCLHCGLSSKEGEPDPCINIIEGVTSACCGHGMFDDAYVQFEDGSSVWGLEAQNYISKAKKENK